MSVSTENSRLSGIDVLPIKHLASKIRFNPFEEQFPAVAGPPAFIMVCNLFGIAVGEIGKQDNILIVFGIDQLYTSHGFRVKMLGLCAGQPEE